MAETWKDIKGYEGLYQISNGGKVRSLIFRNNKTQIKRTKELTLTDNGNGYLIVGLSKNGKKKNHYIHRLVAECFVSKKSDTNIVNHKDYNCKNNNADNLEWCTQKENVIYSKDRMKHPKSKAKPTNTGEKYIRRYVSKNKYQCYRVVIKTQNICKQFKTFEDALMFRDEVMKNV